MGFNSVFKGLKLPLMFTANRAITGKSEMKSSFFWNVVWP